MTFRPILDEEFSALAPRNGGVQRQAVAPSRKEATPKIRAAPRNRQGYFGVQSHPAATGRCTRLERKRQAVAVAGPVHVTIIDS